MGLIILKRSLLRSSSDFSLLKKPQLKKMENNKTMKAPTKDELMILLLEANNQEPVPSLLHLVCETYVAGQIWNLQSQFTSWILENEVGLLYNRISACREHEEDVL